MCISFLLTCQTIGEEKRNASQMHQFEAFVRVSLTDLNNGQTKIMQDISYLRVKVQQNEAALDKISSQFTTLNEGLERLKGELHGARCKVDKVESHVQKHAEQIQGMYDRLLSLERYSREHNLRFHNAPESAGEDCGQRIHDIILNQLNLEPVIENAHRVGPRADNKPRAIICKFLYRPERYKVFQKKRDLQDGVWITEDLI